MKKKTGYQLDNIVPFNYMWIGSCYHHAICAAMPHFGIDCKQFMLAKYAFFADGLGFSRPDDSDRLFDEFGILVQDAHFDTVRDVIAKIDEGVPVLVGLDCFYIRVRFDTYGRTHASHFLLAYGYDRRKKVLLTVDHGYINSPDFHKTTLSFADFAAGNAAFTRFFGQNGSSGKLLYHTEAAAPSDFRKRLAADESGLRRSQQALENNLAYIGEVLGRGFAAFMREKDRIYAYINESILNRNILICTAGYFSIPDWQDFLERLTQKYLKLNAMIGKIGCTGDEVLYEQKKTWFADLLSDIAAGEKTLHTALQTYGRTV